MNPYVSLADLPLRPELKGTQPYGAPQIDVPVRLNTNENPYPPSEAVITDLQKAFAQIAADINRYPDREAIELRTALADYLNQQLPSTSPSGLIAENTWAANGSNEVMTHLCQAFAGPDRKVLTFTPTYSMYPEYVRNTHSSYVRVARGADYRIDLKSALTAIAEHDPHVVLIATPNNPTGTTTDLDTIRAIAAATDKIVVIDEAYQEFSRHPELTALSLLPEFANLVVVRTMSKAFAFAGGRVGYLAANPAIVDACRIVRLPYHLSTQTQRFAMVGLAHAGEMLSNVAKLRAVRDDMLTRLPQLGVEVIDSDANFCLFGRFDDRHDVWEQLVQNGVLVRETGPDGWLRVSAGTPAECEAFFSALARVLGR
ncbi:MAG: histidinol-phosphate transaminase [Propionibacteriaceae bacterium]|nr:histidinol-phosphate transaminase [Propionibacteriaceae bacterium]